MRQPQSACIRRQTAALDGDFSMAGFLLDLLFPGRCPVCGRLLYVPGAPGQAQGIHFGCQSKLLYISEPVCMQCGKPLMNEGEELCTDCRRRRHHFTQGRGIWVYDRWMQQSIAAFKYKGAREYGDFYVRQMMAVQGDWLRALPVDVVIPVPVYWKKKQKRGYNQAAVIAKKLAKILAKPYDERYLRRTLRTEPQKTLSPLQRYANLKKALSVKGKPGKYRCVLLVDDIYTTGSTMDACASALKQAGVETVYFISLCTGSDREG